MANNVLVLAALTEATGNAVTARRIAAHLAASHRVTLLDANTVTLPALRELVREQRVDVALGLHALLAGPFLAPLEVPYALVFGGTDLYEQTHALHQAQMARAVAGAARLVAFSAENRARAEWMWPDAAGRVELLPQAVDALEPDPDYSLRGALGLCASDVLAVLPTGIRRVKDPLHVVDAISVWHAVHPSVHLAIVGALLEADYAEEALDVLAERPGVHFVSALTRPRMLAAIREADVVLNTSLSEGMCGVLLEAMALERPVVARRNAGNESLVVHGHTGLLYDAPGELVHWINALVASPSLRGRLARTAANAVAEVHSPAHEKRAYERVVRDVAAYGRPSTAAASVARVDELDRVADAADRVGIDPATRAALDALVTRVRGDAELAATRHALSGLLATAPPSVAIAQIRRTGLERSLGRDAARLFYLLLALLEVPAAQARHAARGIDPALTRATLADLAEWAAHLHALSGTHGITLETLAWAQRYLRGELVRLGALQYDLRPFPGPLRAYRHRRTRALSVASLDGRAVDVATGMIGDARAPAYAPEDWQLALEPGSPMLEMNIPTNTLPEAADIAESIRLAYALFARLAPETIPVGIFGESWRLDPQVVHLFPDDSGLRAMQRACALHPSALPEARTIRRLFGPDVQRADLASMPREAMDPVRRAVAGFLASPTASLRARCGFVLREEVEAMPEWS